MIKKINEIEKIKNLQEEFISVMAHELRTPATLIKGYINLVLELEGKNLSSQAHQYLKIALLGVDRLINLTAEFLSMIELEDEEGKIKTRPFSIIKIINSVIEKNIRQAKKKGIKLIFKRYKTKNLPKVKINDNLIKVVIDHLIENALKFTEKGKIEVSTKVIQKKRKKFIIVEVSDTGIGIPFSQQKVIFEKLTQVGRKIYQKAGTGLGLYICKLIIEKHGGKIWVKSKVGRGSVFSFSLPL